MKKTIAVIFGGRSSEYGVSLQSAYSVLTQIKKNTMYCQSASQKTGYGITTQVIQKICYRIHGIHMT